MSEQRDVVERLEEAGWVVPFGLCGEAAAEIRRLRSMLEGAKKGWAGQSPEWNRGDWIFTEDPIRGNRPALLLLLPRDTEAE